MPAEGSLVQITRTGPTKVFSETTYVSAPTVTTTQFTGPATPVVKIAPAWADTAITPAGSFFEADLSLANPVDESDCVGDLNLNDDIVPDNPCVPSTRPLGVSNDPRGPFGSYYAAIGGSLFRIAHVSLPTPAGGVATGCGSVAVNNSLGFPAGTAHFSFTAYRNSTLSPVKGSLTYTSPNGNVTSMTLTDLTFSGNTATIRGTCSAGCTTFKLTVTDGGWQASNDSFTLIRNPVPILDTGLAEGGSLSSGSIKVWHQ